MHTALVELFQHFLKFSLVLGRPRIGSEECFEIRLAEVVRAQSSILAVGYPAEAVCYLSIPRGLVLPLNFLDVLDCVEREVKFYLRVSLRRYEHA